MAEENTNEPADVQPESTDPLEEAFKAPAAEGHPEPEGVTESDALASAEADASGADTDAETSADAALAAERLEDLRRLQAEFTNFKNRSAKEKEQLREFVIADLVTNLLPVIDDIDAARNHGDLEEGPFAAIAKKLTETLEKQGLERFGTVGDAFDPQIHEAVLQQPTSEVEPDHVSMVLRNGYKVKDRVVRTAQVAVAAAE
ncbi:MULTISPECIES: nucleotide exchange factor GrpE [unclassified Rothia (in: high G+C Gram-positive bacteria)]|uniref:nucleotide exchange factor GrpE n=1 Tax=unclassified Rothia (in: high G+C Gram-positive bacteria) TaxID=2689056 RepID=UPI00195D3B0C|nr:MULTISPECIES: nucleotide exchange factor GrpE [unclassified Rothia (in: high G+C Gram-positive bacteria)]MBM7051504.1 nucleotide exchange factor GrpE [Rothia sp. ZJ1223]QRZ61289.1 nucleotide exchange factor GrpE [Rothia sp. ZJ932]